MTQLYLQISLISYEHIAWCRTSFNVIYTSGVAGDIISGKDNMVYFKVVINAKDVCIYLPFFFFKVCFDSDFLLYRWCVQKHTSSHTWHHQHDTLTWNTNLGTKQWIDPWVNQCARKFNIDPLVLRLNIELGSWLKLPIT